MRTDALIAMLAAGPVAADPSTAGRRMAAALALGVAIAGAAMLVVLGPRHDLAAAALLPMFWLKLVVTTLLAAGFGIAALRLAVPGGDPRLGGLATALVVAALWGMALIELSRTAPGDRVASVQGTSAWQCVASIALLSLPVMAALFVALRGLAPTRLRLAGLSAGALSGSVAAAIYAVHCHEMAAPFLAVWYLLGIGLPAALGAAIGGKLLRWT